MLTFLADLVNDDGKKRCGIDKILKWRTKIPFRAEDEMSIKSTGAIAIPTGMSIGHYGCRSEGLTWEFSELLSKKIKQ